MSLHGVRATQADKVGVVGVGVGTLTSAALLARQGRPVVVEHLERPAAPALVLNEVTLALLRDLWGEDVVAGSHPITQRRVRWGAAADEVVVPVASVALEGRVLLERLLERLPAQTPVDGPPQWVVDGTRRDPSRRVTFGRRCVIQAGVALDTDEASTAWVETVDQGWVHLAPLSVRRAVVQCMVASSPTDPSATLAGMVAATTAIRERIGATAGPVVLYPAAPSLSVPACGPGWIGVADAAVNLDPISGFGTAWSLRGGVLAAAVIEAISSGLPVADCLRHYDDRLRVGLFEHVEQCLRVYGDAFASPEWHDELSNMARALEDERRLHPEPSFRLRLGGLRLEPAQPLEKSRSALIEGAKK